MDQLPLLRNAYFPDLPLLSLKQPLHMDRISDEPRATLAFLAYSHDDGGIFHPSPGHEDAVVYSSDRGHSLWIFLLFRHHNRCRPYMEVRDTGLRSSHHSRYYPMLPWPLFGRWCPCSPVCNDADSLQPCPDVLLLPVRDNRGGDSLSGERG